MCYHVMHQCKMCNNGYIGMIYVTMRCVDAMCVTMVTCLWYMFPCNASMQYVQPWLHLYDICKHGLHLCNICNHGYIGMIYVTLKCMDVMCVTMVTIVCYVLPWYRMTWWCTHGYIYNNDNCCHDNHWCEVCCHGYNDYYMLPWFSLWVMCNIW